VRILKIANSRGCQVPDCQTIQTLCCQMVLQVFRCLMGVQVLRLPNDRTSGALQNGAITYKLSSYDVAKC